MPDQTFIQIRVSEDRKARVQAIANKEYRTISALIWRALEKEYPELKEVKE